jgi:putative DNA primase/helicase
MIDPQLETIIDFFCSNQIPLLPCFGITNGQCNCRKGKNCPSPGKHPLVFRWQLIASFDKAKVMSWFGGNKKINLAVRTGVRNPINDKYFIGADFDLVNHPTKLILDKSSTTLTQRSGSGGSHSFYWSDYPVRNSVELVEEKMDIRGSGGIVIIAPSNHISGNNYEFSCDLKSTIIQPLPELIKEKVFAAKPAKITTPNSSVEKRPNLTSKKTCNSWGLLSVKQIRNLLSCGSLIPQGVRNSTIHRLLSSDRAKGVLTKAELRMRGQEYLEKTVNKEEIENELETIIGSVMKYPAYNNCHEKVNELYVKWLEKKKKEDIPDLEKLNSLDDEFFACLTPTMDSGVSLNDIIKAREFFFKKNGINQHSSYKPQLLAKKLRELNLTRKRTAKENLWMVQIRLPECYRLDQEQNSNMDSKKEENIKSGSKKIKKITTKIKRVILPTEKLYGGKTGFEFNMALLEYLSRLSDEQKKEFETGSLVLDFEKTKEWIESVKVGDVIGAKCEMLRVLEVNKNDSASTLKVQQVQPTKKAIGEFAPVRDAQVKHLTILELDFFRELGLLEILWRDFKPYAFSEEEDITVYVPHDEESEENI